MSQPPKHPARLFVVLARQAPRAVILRRGPSAWVRLILWHTDTDTFEGGQWLHGRVFGRRCDLAPDGSLFVYFAHKSGYIDPAYRDSWTAVSKPPYFTALALWPLGHTWGGGGLFLGNKHLWLNHNPACASAHPRHQPPKRLRIEGALPGGTGGDVPIYTRLLERNGWTMTQQAEHVPFGAPLLQPATWQKPHPAQTGTVLEMKLLYYWPHHYGDPYRYTWELIRADGERLPLAGATWAGWDQVGRLAWARNGHLFAAPPDEAWLDMPPLADFNGQRFEEIEAPGWARRW
jgi:hypothetical protein